jgi:flagellar biosynthesis/type III secretory pathway protein FliH
VLDLVLKRFEPLTDLPELHDLPEVQEMIEERIDAWKHNLVQQGMLQGIQKGMQQGEYAGILKGKQEGRLEGLQQGERKGKLEGQIQLLLRFLMRRFGVLPPAVVMQINAAKNLEQIEAWFDAAIDAPNLNAVFLLH